MCEVVTAGNALIQSPSSSTQHCETVEVNSDSLLVLLEIGTAVVVILLIAGLTMKALGKKIVHSKYLHTFCYMIMTISYIFSATWILTNATATFGLIWSRSFPLTVVCMVFLISTVALMNNHAAISGELFSTKYK